MHVKAILLLSMFLILSNGPAYAETAADHEISGCLACHSAMKGKIKSAGGVLIELNVDAEKFQSSVHGSLKCSDCHVKYSPNPHTQAEASVPADISSLASKLGAKHPKDPAAAAACGKCHPEISKKVLESVHGKNIMEKNQTDGAYCLDCHGTPHYIVSAKNPEAMMSRERQVETCGKCHGDEKLNAKYGIQQNVMNSFIESFHGRKLHLGHTRVPVCTSCHNSHDIMSKSNPASPVFGANKIATCGKCHKGANEKFVPAITHRPPGPIPHYAEKGLIVLTMGTFIFIVSHVLLEAFSDIRDAVFRKRRDD